MLRIPQAEYMIEALKLGEIETGPRIELRDGFSKTR
jgi:hypothetical protein